MKQYEAWLCNLPTNENHIQYGIRPVVIVSNNKNNEYSPNVTVVPVTTKYKGLPTHVKIGNESIACCEQILTIPKHYLIKRLWVLKYTDKLKDGLRRQLGL